MIPDLPATHRCFPGKLISYFCKPLLLLAVISTALLSGCAYSPAEPPWVAAVAGDGPGDPRLVSQSAVVVENLPKSRRGNPPVYSVFGQAYKVMDTAVGFKEWGLASWYGKKFHGRETSSGEVYDMHAMTAAHKHLPLPTFVRVTRMDNGESIIVKVNDRGPFVENRVIDLSYAAAKRLNMVNQGKAEVFIEALSSHHIDKPVQQVADSTIDANWQSVAANDLYIQVGAYSLEPNAVKMRERIEQIVQPPVRINLDVAKQLHHVRVGPMQDEYTVSMTLQKLQAAGIETYTVVQ